MTKYFTIICFILCQTIYANSQKLETTKFFAFTPELETKINGIGLGLMLNSLKYEGDSTTTIINGLNLEIIGVGFFSPLVPSNPIAPYHLESEKEDDKRELILDTLIQSAKLKQPYVINGITISLGGTAGHEVQINGINISGIGTVTSQMNGLSVAIIMNMNCVMNGVSIGFTNESLEHNGLQIGILNTSYRTRGIQIGLWNKNEKRSLPFINWNF